ncbi:MAG: hypothetical protein E5X74_32820, partial [Mesorhizobium sp.]
MSLDLDKNNINAFGLQIVDSEFDIGDGGGDNENKNHNTNDAKNENENENKASNENENKSDNDNSNDNKSSNENENKASNENENKNQNSNESKNENSNENKNVNETKVDVDVDVGVKLEGELGNSDDDFADIGKNMSGDMKDNTIINNKDGNVTYDPGDDVTFKDILNNSMTGAGNNSASFINQVNKLDDNDKLDNATVSNTAPLNLNFNATAGEAKSGDGISAGGGGGSGGDDAKANGGEGGNGGDAKSGDVEAGDGKGGLALSAAIGGDSKSDN